MYDFKYEHFNSIYDFEQKINSRPQNNVFSGCHESKNNGYDFTETHSYDEAQDLLKNGWNAQVDSMTEELKKFSRTIEVERKKQIKSIAGYAPCVPNAIRGVPKSMISTTNVNRKEKKKTVHIILNNTASGSTESSELMKSGMTCLKLAMVLDRMGVRTKIDVIPKMSISGNSCYGCTVSIKDYRQPFNPSKMAYPLAHTSFFRRHGFKFFETMPECTNDGMRGGYGSSMIYHKGEDIFNKYMEFAGFMKDDVVYIDLDDVRRAGFDYKKLADNKGLKLN